MFKVGDRVKRITHLEQDPKRGWPAFVEDKIYTVSSVSNTFLAIEGMGKEGGGGSSHPYDLDCFELVKPEPQAAAIAGGLQEHSVGEYYPLAAVMYEHNGERIITIENLQTGEVNGFGLYPCDWGSFEQAYRHIERITNGYAWSKTKGRVSYASGGWVVAEPANPVRVTRLRNMLHRG